LLGVNAARTEVACARLLDSLDARCSVLVGPRTNAERCFNGYAALSTRRDGQISAYNACWTYDDIRVKEMTSRNVSVMPRDGTRCSGNKRHELESHRCSDQLESPRRSRRLTWMARLMLAAWRAGREPDGSPGGACRC
jgi:hypothetical protein